MLAGRLVLSITLLVLVFAAAGEARAKPRAKALKRDSDLAELLARVPGINPRALASAMKAIATAKARESSRNLLTLIDYSLPSTEKRLWVIDLRQQKVLFHELVAHGKNTGENLARAFSNVRGSLQSSLGLFRTLSTYEGKHGYSLKLEGLDRGINDLARERAIVIHAADYVSEDFIRRRGRLGRSWGCPALRPEIATRVIDTIKDGSLVFAYHPEGAPQDDSSYFGEISAP